MDISDAIQLIALFLLILLSAFFSSCETALTTVNRLRIRNMVDDKVKHAKTVNKLLDNQTKMLGTILVGNNIVNISASSLATTLTIKLFGNYAVGITTGVLTLIVLIFGEITPKTIATASAEKLSLRYAPIIYFLTIILTPITFLTNQLSRFFLFIFRIDQNKQKATITEEDLRTIFEVSHEEGVIESDERTMITNVVDFGDSVAKDVMVPRIDMSFANTDMSYEDLVYAFKKDQYSRMPVYFENRDNIIGIIYLKDIFFNYNPSEEFDIQNYLRPVYFTYEFQKTSELLSKMKKDRISIAIVLDEYGAVAGLVTLEDLIEEIVGEIRDEYDSDEVDLIQKISDTEYLAKGTAKLDDINELLDLDISSDDYDSIAGHILCLLGHIPRVNEKIKDGDITYIVSKIEKHRIDQVKILLPIKTNDDES